MKDADQHCWASQQWHPAHAISSHKCYNLLLSYIPWNFHPNLSELMSRDMRLERPPHVSVQRMPFLIVIWIIVPASQCLAINVGLKVGDIVVTQQSSGSIYKVDPSTGIATLAMSNNSLTGLAQVILDSQNRALVATRSTYGILRFNFATGVAESVASGPFLENPYSLALDHAGDLIVGSGDDWLTRVNLSTGAQQHLSHFTNSTSIQDIEVASDGLIYVLDFGVFPSGGGRVLTVDPTTGSQHLLAQGGEIYQGSDMVIEADGNLIVQTSKIMSSKLVRVDAHTGQQQMLFSYSDEGFIALDGDGSLLFAEFYAKSVQRIDLNTGSHSTFGHISTTGNLTGIAVVMPVPEPSAMSLAVLSAIIVLVRRRSRCR